MKKRIGQLYIRKLKSTDKTDTMITAVRMVVFKNGYGLFRHGFKHCLNAARSKFELKKMFFLVGNMR